MSQPVSRHRSVGVWLLIAFTGAVALSACGGSPTPGVLTQAEIPSYLGVTAHPSVPSSAAGVVQSILHCKRVNLELFAVPGKLSRFGASPVIISSLQSCATIADAKSVFPFSRGSGHAVKGIGNDAELVGNGISPQGVRADLIEWRDGSHVGLILLEGPPSDKRITPALAELLARRAAAGS